MDNNIYFLTFVHFLPGEQYTYKCLSCPFSSMTISQLKEHSLTDHGEVLTLPKLRAATQAAHAAIRLPRQAAHTDHSHLTTDGITSSSITFSIDGRLLDSIRRRSWEVFEGLGGMSWMQITNGLDGDKSKSCPVYFLKGCAHSIALVGRFFFLKSS